MNDKWINETKLWTVEYTDNQKQLLDDKDLKEAAGLLAQGEVVAFPTETVYGLGANALSTEAVNKIFKAKGRPGDNPLIVHIASMDQLQPLVQPLSSLVNRCMERFWPGPITFVLRSNGIVPANVTAGLNTIGVRMPSHPVAQALIKLANVPIAAPSANLSGRPSPTLAQHVLHDLRGRISGIVDGGPAGFGVESTVVDMTGPFPVILRPGGITAEQLQEVTGEVRWDPSLYNSNEAPLSPGMKYTHYAPNGTLFLVEGPINATYFEKINEYVKQEKKQGEKVGILTTVENEAKYDADVVLSCGSRGDLQTVASKLYNVLRTFDDNQVTVIFSEMFPEEGIGIAIMNRLQKASGGKIV